VRLGLAVGSLCCLVAVGCGGHGSRARTERSNTAHQADNLAYVEIARASGTLRANAAATALGHSRRIANLAAISAASQTVLRVRPSDSGLLALRGSMRAALSAALAARRDPRSQHTAALAALKATDTINGRLRLYATRHPDVRALVPD
jgi:hypothetical protein